MTNDTEPTENETPTDLGQSELKSLLCDFVEYRDHCFCTNQLQVVELLDKIILMFTNLEADKKEMQSIKRLQNEIVRLRAYVQRGRSLLRPFAGNREIDEYRERANRVLKETL